jgi:signal transduction histidine kinase
MPIGGLIIIKSKTKDGYIVIEISDYGRGIDENFISRIFGPFFTTREVGTDLGLAIVQKVIEGHSGKIDVMVQGGMERLMSSHYLYLKK